MPTWQVVWTHFCGNVNTYKECTGLSVDRKNLVEFIHEGKPITLIGGELEITQTS